MVRKQVTNSASEIGVYDVAGDGNAVRIHKGHRENPAIETRSLCYIDGDSRQEEDVAEGIVRLPGGVPESTVFNYVEGNIERLSAVLAVACHLEAAAQERVKRAIKDVSLENRDPHTLFAELGLKLGFLPEELVKSAFVNLWIEGHKQTCEEVVTPIRQMLAEEP